MSWAAAHGGPVFDIETAEDRAILAEVYDADDYRLSGRELTGRSVVDVGACFGAFTLAAAFDYGATVWAVEPNPVSRGRLIGHTIVNGVEERVKFVGKAIGSGDYDRAVSLGEGGGAWTSTDPDVEIGAAVETITLDRVLSLAASKDPDGRVAHLKVDCEGAEWDALLPADLLHLVDFVACEWHGQEIVERPLRPSETVGALVDKLAQHFHTEQFGKPGRGGMIVGWRYEGDEPEEEE